MFEVTITDGTTACYGCEGFIATATEDVLILAIPLKPDHQWRGTATFHRQCFLDKANSSEEERNVFIATGVR